MTPPEREASKMRGPDFPRVRIYNPLPKVLEHFTLRLTECFDLSGNHLSLLPSLDGEVGDDRLAKALALATHIRRARQYLHDDRSAANVVVWPLLGWWDIPLWQHSMQQTFVIVHDPEPLAKQSGLTSRAGRLASRLTMSQWPQIITMSPEAKAIVTSYFHEERVHLLPHPARKPIAVSPDHHRDVILVLGQYKPARDIGIMADMARSLKSMGWRPTVAGRGWPDIPGWAVRNEFLNEDEFAGILSSAAALLLPYQRYFQSGVALRALEAGIPVVGRGTGFLHMILGVDFPGQVQRGDDAASWVDAVGAAVDQRHLQMQAAELYTTRARREWKALLNGAMENGRSSSHV